MPGVTTGIRCLPVPILKRAKTLRLNVKMNIFFARLWIRLVRKMKGLSMPARERLARTVALMLWLAVPKRRHVIETNLQLCFPEMPPEERKALARRVYVRLARAAIDHGTLWEADAEEIRRFVTFEGLDNLLDMKDGRPVIVVAPHFAGLDAAGIALNTYVRGVSLYQKQSNPAWDKAVLQGRLRFSNPVLIAKSNASDLRPVLRAMKEGLPFYYLPDMDHGLKNSIFVPFFGVQAATLPMVSRLARLTKAKVLWCIATMTENGYHVIISKPWDNFPTADYEADTLRVNQELEEWIRAYPDQYLWVHRRFKTRPEGETPIY